MSVLEVHAVSIVRGGRTILHDVSLRVAPGDFVAIVGPNGSGKSTLLRTLAGLWQSSDGRGATLLDGRPLSEFRRRDIARRIAYVPQDTATEFAFSVAEVVAMGRHPHRGRFERATAADRAAINTALRECDVLHLAERTVNTLSGGERQRVLLARSLAVQPDFVLLDEPTASLDIEHALEILERCRQMASQGRAIVLATHDLNAVARYAQRVALLDRGALVGCGARQEVLNPAALHRVFGVATELAHTASGEAAYVFHRPAPGNGIK